VPNDVRQGVATGGAAARPRHSVRRPTTADLIVEVVEAVGGGLRFVALHPVVSLAMVVMAAVIENSYLRI
jgi:hypothetical protein